MLSTNPCKEYQEKKIREKWQQIEGAKLFISIQQNEINKYKLKIQKIQTNEIIYQRQKDEISELIREISRLTNIIKIQNDEINRTRNEIKELLDECLPSTELSNISENNQHECENQGCISIRCVIQ